MSTRGSLLAATLLALFAFAQPCAAAREEAVDEYLAVADPGLDTWRSEWDLYAWKPAWLSGTSTVDGFEAPLDNDFEDSRDLRNWAAGTRLESWMGPWGVITDVQYMRIDSESGPSGDTVGRVDQTVIDIGAGFRVHESGGKRPLSLDLLVLLRYSIVKQSVVTPQTVGWVEDKQNYAEFAFGLQVRKKIADRWWLWARGDVGGFGWSQSSQLTYNVFVGASFEFGGGSSMVKFGWRLHDIDYELREDPSAFSWKATTHGPFVAYTWVF